MAANMKALLEAKRFWDRAYSRAVAAAERERIAKIIEGLDNTMMSQKKLAAHIRSLVADPIDLE